MAGAPPQHIKSDHPLFYFFLCIKFFFCFHFSFLVYDFCYNKIGDFRNLAFWRSWKNRIGLEFGMIINFIVFFRWESFNVLCICNYFCNMKFRWFCSVSFWILQYFLWLFFLLVMIPSDFILKLVLRTNLGSLVATYHGALSKMWKGSPWGSGDP